VCVAGLAPGAALADESPAPPRHAAPYGLHWLAYIAPEDLPPTRAAVCFVDSGLAVTPDTPADDPNGPVVKRLAVDGGPGEPQGTAPEQLHGTRMAASAIAPANGWGTVGIWPAGRVVSVRAMVAGETEFRADAWRRGVDECLQEHSGNTMLAAINFSLGSEREITGDEAARLADRIAAAHSREISVLGSAGNSPGVGTGAPANFAGVLAVAGGATTGALCVEASYDERVAVLGPACPVDQADPLTGRPEYTLGGGSSTASALTATLLAALRTLRPDATRAQAEAWVSRSARQVEGRPVLDGEAAARAAGLGSLVDRARARMATTSSTASTPPPGPTVVPGTKPASARPADEIPRLPRPVLFDARWTRRRLIIRVKNRPPGARLRVWAGYAARREFTDARRVQRVRTASMVTVELRRRPQRVELAFVSPTGGDRESSISPVLTLHPRRGGRFR
jgi:hypothetical protein